MNNEVGRYGEVDRMGRCVLGIAWETEVLGKGAGQQG